jgi:hypothetical protein
MHYIDVFRHVGTYPALSAKRIAIDCAVGKQHKHIRIEHDSS